TTGHGEVGSFSAKRGVACNAETLGPGPAPQMAPARGEGLMAERDRGALPLQRQPRRGLARAAALDPPHHPGPGDGDEVQTERQAQPERAVELLIEEATQDFQFQLRWLLPLLVVRPVLV